MTGAARQPQERHHLYVHVPFCRLVCAYCDFVTVGGRRDQVPRYVRALERELLARPAPGRLTTIYFGGGTPSLLPADAVARLVEAACAQWRSRPREISLEANPSRREPVDWAGLRAAGVNRLSLGAQALRDEQLSALARGHSVAEVRSAYRDARRAGFENVSLDLIYGIPGQSLGDWREGLRRAIAMQPDHLSLYSLTLPLQPDEWSAPPRPGALRWRGRALARQDDDLAADQYRLAEELLGAAGYRHYELSSWARPGRESRHNLGYWQRRPYTGIGAGAHSYDGRARRWNLGDLDAYLRAMEARGSPIEGREALDEPVRAFEAIALGLRTAEGLSRRAFAREFGADPYARFGPGLGGASARGLVEVTAARIRLTAAGRLLANEALLALLV